MTEDDYRNQEPRPDVRAADGLRAFQFSLLDLFVVVTVVALILSTYFSVGELLGMSTMEVLTLGLARLVFNAPVYLVWIVGITLAFRCLRQNRLPAVLSMIAFGGMLLTSLVCGVLQMALIHSANSNRLHHDYLFWAFTIIGVIRAVIATIAWILILVAIFARRPPDVPKTEQSDPSGDPFLTKEPFNSL